MKRLPTARPLGLVVYRGPSMIDRAPIVVVVTGIRNKSENRKTGAVMQTWIVRADMTPIEAVNTGEDYSVCGDCKHRGPFGARSCYVVVPQAPHQVYKTFREGGYTDATDWTQAELEAVFRGRKIRFGAYGDPAAAPVMLWRRLAAASGGWVGYTHQWRKHRVRGLTKYVMASVDSADEKEEACEAGWRTFRVRTAWEGLDDDEIACPAAPEGGERTDCERCQLCRGQARPAKSVAIVVHGSGAKVFAGV